jgi:hypothetical protein
MKRGRIFASAADSCRLVLVLWLAIVASAAPLAQAVEVTGLYTVEVPLDPDDQNAQASAYRAALSEVLVRLTGTTEAAESEQMAALFPNPARFVRQYQPGPDDTLIVSLDGPSIEAALRQSGATVWGIERPLTIVWLAVDWGLGDREIVAADDPDRVPANRRSIDRNRILRERVQAAATRRGLPVVFPLLDAEDLEKIGFIDIWGGFDDPLLEASARYGADSILVGRIRPEDQQVPRWTWYMGGQRFAWPGEPEQAMDQLADALAARDAIRGDEAIESIELTISGINSVSAYGQVQRYLENLRGLDSLMVRSAAPDRITYEIEVQGGGERLVNVLAASRILRRVENEFAFDGGGFQLNGAGDRRFRALEYSYIPPAPADASPGLVPEARPES